MYNEYTMKKDNSTLTVLKALSDETRLQLVRKFARSKVSIPTCDLVNSCSEFLKLSQPTMSHHVGKLVDAHVLIEQKKGIQKLYKLNRALLNEIGIRASKL